MEGNSWSINSISGMETGSYDRKRMVRKRMMNEKYPMIPFKKLQQKIGGNSGILEFFMRCTIDKNLDKTLDSLIKTVTRLSQKHSVTL